MAPPPLHDWASLTTALAQKLSGPPCTAPLPTGAPNGRAIRAAARIAAPGSSRRAALRCATDLLKPTTAFGSDPSEHRVPTLWLKVRHRRSSLGWIQAAVTYACGCTPVCTLTTASSGYNKHGFSRQCMSPSGPADLRPRFSGSCSLVFAKLETLRGLVPARLGMFQYSAATAVLHLSSMFASLCVVSSRCLALVACAGRVFLSHFSEGPLAKAVSMDSQDPSDPCTAGDALLEAQRDDTCWCMPRVNSLVSPCWAPEVPSTERSCKNGIVSQQCCNAEPPGLKWPWLGTPLGLFSFQNGQVGRLLLEEVLCLYRAGTGGTD